MSKASKTVENTKSPAGMFVPMVLDMSWRLLIVVLAPIVIGNKLDSALGVHPTLTIVGLILAVLGTVLVIKSMVKKADEAIAAADNKGAKHD